MHSFRRTIVNSLVFVLLFAIIAGVVIYPSFTNGSEYNDSGARKDLSGKLNLLFVGSSYSTSGFIPDVFDKKLGCNSYNLSGDAASLNGRYELLKKELSRNKIKSVILEISYETLSEDIKAVNATGEPRIITKLDTFSEKINYFFNNVSFFNNDYENFLSVSLRYGLKAWKDIASGSFGTIQGNKGFRADAPVDVSLKENEVVNKYNINEASFNFRDENLKKYKEMIQLCAEHGADVYLVNLPQSDAEMWKYSNYDEFLFKIKNLAHENDCMLIDCNLLKSRFTLFNDSYSFNNLTHLSSKGAEAFSEEFSDILLKINSGEDISSFFYSSYEEMKADSPYMKIYKSLTQTE